MEFTRPYFPSIILYLHPALTDLAYIEITLNNYVESLQTETQICVADATLDHSVCKYHQGTLAMSLIDKH